MLEWHPVPSYPYYNEPKFYTERMLTMYVGTKGWYVEELKKRGIRYIEQKKVEKYKAHILANVLEQNK